MSGGGARILIVEDEPGIVRALKTNLGAHGFQVETAGSSAQAMESYARRRPDLILLDLGLPDRDGKEIISLVRRETQTPIIVLSVRDAEREKVQALTLGADDYLTKPFGPDELLARVRVALRHSARPQAGADAVIKSGDLELDVERRQARRAGEEVRLTPTEFDLLKALMQHMDKIMTDRMLLQEVWGVDYSDEAHYLHVYVARLRKKIEADPRRPARLLTEPGVGYRFVSEE
jgi:two-component system, OmpR family, KDP operon response regulator KdpE